MELVELQQTPGTSTTQNALVAAGGNAAVLLEWSSDDEEENQIANRDCIVENEEEEEEEVARIVNTVTNSSDVHIIHRNTRVYQAPVTVNQTVYNQQADSNEASDAEDSHPRNYCFVIAILVAIVISSLVIVISIWLSNMSLEQSVQSSISTVKLSQSAEDDEPRIITRYDWDSVIAIKPNPKLSIIPAPYVVISETKTSSCNTTEKCKQRVRAIQSLYSKIFNVDDIPFNFLIGGDGLIYEGRNWDVVGDHTFTDYNDRSVIITFIGSFSGKNVPTENQLKAARDLISFGVKNGKIREDYKLKGRRQFRLPQHDENPSDNLYDIIKTWEHWDSKIESISRQKLN